MIRYRDPNNGSEYVYNGSGYYYVATARQAQSLDQHLGQFEDMLGAEMQAEAAASGKPIVGGPFAQAVK